MKYSGKLGLFDTIEASPGDWEPTITEKPCRGDLLQSVWRNQDDSKVNSDIKISNRISVVLTPYLYANFSKIKYATWAGAKWTVTSVEVNYPRLILTLGEVWNDGQET